MSSVIRLNNQVNANANQTFTGTGTIQTFTVPNGVFWIRFFMWGAGGWGQNATRQAGAGAGAYVEGNLRTAPGTVYSIIVGRAGQSGLANGGGTTTAGTGANGGGFSGIFLGSPSTSTVIAIAGGGGGSGFNGNGQGGSGGYPNGSSATAGGTGGTQTAAGVGWSTGSQLAGGAGAGGDQGGGGGGGGWWGGGGGINQQAGGGGSSTYISSVINPITVNGVNGAAAANESSPFWVSPYGRSGYDGYVVIGFNAATSSLPIQITLGNVLSSTGTAFITDNTTYTFPANVSKVRVFVWGGGGGNKGGSGAHVAGDINKGSMTTLTIYLNRGGGLYGPGGGVVAGGYGAVYNSTNGYLMIAGAGGTGGDKYGGGGGYLQGSQGGSPSLPGARTTVRNYSNGGGGSQTQGGQGGFGNDSGNYISGAPGGYLQGGDGNRGSAYGQGGGGGYYGGGGGNGDANGGGFYTGNGAGGGGSSYVNPGFVTNYKGEDGLNGSTTSVLPGGASSPFYVSGYGVGALSGGGGGALVVIVPYLSGGGGSSTSSTAPAQITLGNVLSSTATAFITDNTTYTIPPKTSKIRIFVWGGGGNGNNYGSSGCGGSGAHVQGDFTVGSITSLTIYLNRGAGPGHFGNNGAGYGAVYNATTGYLLIAGGGGGSGSGYGGGGGYLQGFSGGSPSIAGQVSVQSTAIVGSGGGGGSQTQGGDGARSAGAGSYLQGGSGEMSAYPSGGGGGYYGGGGGNGNGAAGLSGNGPGGGGSSYINMGYIKNYMGFDGQSGSTSSVLPGGASSPYYVAGYGVGGRLTNGGGALVVIVPYVS